MTRLSMAVAQIVAARNYTLRLLDNSVPADWFRQPTEGVSHIGWQVGHLAVAEYWLAIQRRRGRRREDDNLITEEFLRRFGRESVADPNPANNPSPSELRTILDKVHQQTLHELKMVTEEELDQPTIKPHPQFNTKLGALFWCAQHEMVHAGQIGLLRRLLGSAPLW